MGFFDKVKEVASSAAATASEAAKSVSDKSKEMAEKARINKAIKAEETKINNFYISIGKKIFDSNSEAPSGYETQFEGIKKAMGAIDELNIQMSSVCNEEGNAYCSKCGAKIKDDQLFCQCCGEKQNAPVSRDNTLQQEVVSEAESSETISEEISEEAASETEKE